ncbi:MAG: shikimate kinase [Clostridia bacterium]
MKNNVVLIGMPGSGKSTIGVLLAKIIGYDFIDSDLLIQSREGKKLCEIINDSGLEYFDKVENEVNASITCSNTVIATGGSVVYGKEAMEHLKKIGTVAYLNVPLAEIERRIDNMATRGISIKEGQTLKDLYNERTVLYKKYADVEVKFNKKSISKNAYALAEALGFPKELYE